MTEPNGNGNGRATIREVYELIEKLDERQTQAAMQVEMRLAARVDSTERRLTGLITAIATRVTKIERWSWKMAGAIGVCVFLAGGAISALVVFLARGK